MQSSCKHFGRLGKINTTEPEKLRRKRKGREPDDCGESKIVAESRRGQPDDLLLEYNVHGKTGRVQGDGREKSTDFKGDGVRVPSISAYVYVK